MQNKDLAIKYLELSQAYEDKLNHYKDLIWVSSLLQGVITEIESEILKYNKKTGKKAQEAENRLKIIKLSFDKFDFLINECERQNILNTVLANENVNLKNQIEDLNKKIEDINDFNL